MRGWLIFGQRSNDSPQCPLVITFSPFQFQLDALLAWRQEVKAPTPAIRTQAGGAGHGSAQHPALPSIWMPGLAGVCPVRAVSVQTAWQMPRILPFPPPAPSLTCSGLAWTRLCSPSLFLNRHSRPFLWISLGTLELYLLKLEAFRALEAPWKDPKKL